MSSFNIERLKSPLKDVFKSHLKWVEANWQETLKRKRKDLYKLLEKTNLFDIWSNNLQDTEVTKHLIPEMFMDAFMSFHFACTGLYKYANVFLRSELETSLRLVYFSTHPIEFEWWCDSNKWYKGKDVWSEGYGYFLQLKTVKDFDKKLPKEQNLFNKIKNIYGTLSQYVHSSKSALHTLLEFSPKYQADEFKKWSANYSAIQQYVNTIIILGFALRFKEMRKREQNKILKIGVYDINYRRSLKDIFGLKISGRI
jgi:hypothetical protein